MFDFDFPFPLIAEFTEYELEWLDAIQPIDMNSDRVATQQALWKIYNISQHDIALMMGISQYTVWRNVSQPKSGGCKTWQERLPTDHYIAYIKASVYMLYASKTHNIYWGISWSRFCCFDIRIQKFDLFED